MPPDPRGAALRDAAAHRDERQQHGQRAPGAAAQDMSGRSGFGRMAVIVPEFHAACKIEARDAAPVRPARQAGGRSEAEAARLDAIDGAARLRAFPRAAGSANPRCTCRRPGWRRCAVRLRTGCVTLVRSACRRSPSPTPAMPKTRRMRRPSPRSGPPMLMRTPLPDGRGRPRIASARLSSRGRDRRAPRSARAGNRRPAAKQPASRWPKRDSLRRSGQAACVIATTSAAAHSAAQCAMRHASYGSTSIDLARTAWPRVISRALRCSVIVSSRIPTTPRKHEHRHPARRDSSLDSAVAHGCDAVRQGRMCDSNPPSACRSRTDDGRGDQTRGSPTDPSPRSRSTRMPSGIISTS